MKAEGRKVVRWAQDAGLGGGGVSVVGNRRGPDLAEDTWGFTFLQNQLAFLENEFQRSMTDYARRLDKLEKEVDAIKRTVPKIASNNRLVKYIIAHNETEMERLSRDLATLGYMPRYHFSDSEIIDDLYDYRRMELADEGKVFSITKISHLTF